MQPEDLARFRSLSDPRLHPDGRRIAFTVSRLDLDDDRTVSEIWLWDGERARPFSRGPTDRSPRWSPDGTRLAFLRGEEEGGRAQVAVMEVAGGEARVVTRFPLGAEELEWSPDGRRLVAVGVVWSEELADLDDEERARRPRRVDRVPWRMDRDGWVYDRRRHLYVVDPDREETRGLTEGDFDERSPAWRPDGGAVAFLSARHERRGLEPGVQAYQVDLEGGEVRMLADTGSWGLVSYRPDGVPHLVGRPDQWSHPLPAGVWRLEGDGGMTDLTGALDRSVLPFNPPPAPAGPRWVGEGFVIVLEDRGRVRLIRVDPDGSVADLVGGGRVVRGADPHPDGSRIAFVATGPTDPGELWWWEEGEERRLTGLNEEFREEVPLSAPHAFPVEVEGADVDAWVYLPPGDGPVPVLLNIHGGPASQYGLGFFDEFQVYAGAGYGVVACNPRGSSGRGGSFAREVVGEGWGSVDVADVTAALEEALARYPRLDPDRLGVMGGSYGGFLTAWLIARDHRFRSAVVERALVAWESFSGTSDIGPYFSRTYLEAELPDGYQVLHDASPLATAHRIRTPTLVLHSEDDFRCPIEQAEQFFVALRKAGVESEMVCFPGEGHELSRSGRPRHRRERFQIVLDWHGRHLGEGGSELAT